MYDAGDAAGALDVFEQSLELRREQADRLGETRALVGVCQALVAVDEVAQAEALSRELLEAAGGDPRTKHFAYAFLGDCALIRHEFDEADPLSREFASRATARRPVETSAAVEGIAMA